MADRRTIPPGAGLIFFGLIAFAISLASIAVLLLTRSPLLGLASYAVLWLIAFAVAWLKFGDDHG